MKYFLFISLAFSFILYFYGSEDLEEPKHTTPELYRAKEIVKANPTISDGFHLDNYIAVKSGVSSDESKKEIEFHKLYESIQDEIDSGVFTHIVEFHSILSYCDGVPRSLEDRQNWISKNASSSESDINVLDGDIESCQHIPVLSFNQKEQLYRIAADLGVEQAKLALAKLIPYDSKEKVELLSRSAVWSEDAAMMIAELAIKNNIYMTSQEKVFWMVVSDIKSTYADIYEHNMSEQLLSLDENEKLQTEKIINLWRSGNVEQMTTAINLLRQIQS